MKIPPREESFCPALQGPRADDGAFAARIGAQMRILIVSDTHRREENLLRLIEKMEPLDLLIHCGDSEESEEFYLAVSECPVQIVAGNNDYFSGLPREREFQLGRYKVWLTHGHNYYVSMGNSVIREEAVSRQGRSLHC